MRAKIVNSMRSEVLGDETVPSTQEHIVAALKRWRVKIGYFSILATLPSTVGPYEARAEETKTSPDSTSLTDKIEKPSFGRNDRNEQPEFLRRRNSYLLPHQKINYNFVPDLAGGDNCPGTVIPVGSYTSSAPYSDTGDTTSANNTVTFLSYYYYYGYSVNGPDLIYSFTLTSRGAAPEIRVTPTTPTYDPTIYLLDGRWGPCPAGTGAFASNWRNYADAVGAGAAEIFSSDVMNYLPLNVPLYLFVDSDGPAPGNSGAYTFRMQDVTLAQGPRTKFDFDADGRSNVSVFRPSNSVWYMNRSSQGPAAEVFGLATDRIVPADYDGDGKTDVAIYRDGTWHLLNSSDRTYSVLPFGLPNDIPQPADYSGDGRAEIAVYRDGTWWTLNLANGQIGVAQFGIATDRPVVADYDGDGRADYAVYRNGLWYLNRSNQGFAAIPFGLTGDRLVPADYDGDNRTDLAVYRAGVWYLLRSSWGFTAFEFGKESDIPSPGDFDGDGYADPTFYRDGIWHLRGSNSGTYTQHFGLANDRPIPSAFAP